MMSQAGFDKRFDHHPPKGDDVALMHEFVRLQIKGVAMRMDAQLPVGRESAMVQTKLEEAMFWANAAIARDTDS